jgi:protocatechuate 3,4-dioxygenase, beta subunit
VASPRRDPSVFPPFLYAAYRSTLARAPTKPLLRAPPQLAGLAGPDPLAEDGIADDNDLTRNAGTGGEAIGERIIVTGRVLTDEGEPIPNTLVEVWQTNSAGRYVHRNDMHDAPLDPNFLGLGRTRTDAHGVYRFFSVRPGAYPWGNHDNAWRPAHIHFSLFGRAFMNRLVTQMYFPGDPLLDLDPIFNSVPSDDARERLLARYAHDVTRPGFALGYRFDIVLSGPEATPFESAGERA